MDDNKKIAPHGMGLKVLKNDDGTFSFPGNNHKFKTMKELISYIKRVRFFQQQNRKSR